MADVNFNIVEHVAVLCDRGRGWVKEVNLVSWNDGAPKVDIREWNSDHTSMKKGITMSKSEFIVFKNSIEKINCELLADYGISNAS